MAESLEDLYARLVPLTEGEIFGMQFGTSVIVEAISTWSDANRLFGRASFLGVVDDSAKFGCEPFTPSGFLGFSVSRTHCGHANPKLYRYDEVLISKIQSRHDDIAELRAHIKEIIDTCTEAELDAVAEILGGEDNV